MYYVIEPYSVKYMKPLEH